MADQSSETPAASSSDQPSSSEPPKTEEAPSQDMDALFNMMMDDISKSSFRNFKLKNQINERTTIVCCSMNRSLKPLFHIIISKYLYFPKCSKSNPTRQHQVQQDQEDGAEVQRHARRAGRAPHGGQLLHPLRHAGGHAGRVSNNTARKWKLFNFVSYKFNYIS